MVSLCRTWIEVLKFSIHFWGTSSVSVPPLWRDSLLFKGFQYYFHSMHPLNWSHIGLTGVNPMLSLCKTLIDILKFSIHFWGTSSFSVPQLWRDSILFKGFQYYFHSMHPLNWNHIGPTGVIPMLSLCKTSIDVLKFSIHFWGTSSFSVPPLWSDSLLFKGFLYYFHSMHPLNWSHIGPTGVIPMLSMCKTWIDVLKFSIHFWGTSSFSVPQLWRDSLLFKGFQYYFHSMQPLNWSHIGPTGVIPMLSLCKTWIDLLKFSIHFWGTSSVSVPQLWRDSLLFKGFKYYFHSIHPT